MLLLLFGESLRWFDFYSGANKKPAWSNASMGLGHAGLLFDGSPGIAGLPFA